MKALAIKTRIEMRTQALLGIQKRDPEGKIHRHVVVEEATDPKTRYTGNSIGMTRPPVICGVSIRLAR